MKYYFNFFLASFRERSASINDGVSLSKCCFMALSLIISIQFVGQNVITVKKKQEEQVEPKLTGFFYSEFYTLESGHPGEPPTSYKRMIIYIDSYNRIYIFHTSKSIKKIYEQFSKNPDKFVEEKGSLEITSDGWIYLTTTPTYHSYSNFKYVGEYISEDQFYLDYKAMADSKVTLRLYLHKY